MQIKQLVLALPFVASVAMAASTGRSGILIARDDAIRSGLYVREDPPEDKLTCGTAGDAPLAKCKQIVEQRLPIGRSNTCNVGIGGSKNNVLVCAGTDGGDGTDDCCVYGSQSDQTDDYIYSSIQKVIDGCGAPQNPDKEGGTVNGRFSGTAGNICVADGNACTDCNT